MIDDGDDSTYVPVTSDLARFCYVCESPYNIRNMKKAVGRWQGTYVWYCTLCHVAKYGLTQKELFDD